MNYSKAIKILQKRNERTITGYDCENFMPRSKNGCSTCIIEEFCCGIEVSRSELIEKLLRTSRREKLEKLLS